ncbi:MAG: hypothetical protein ACFFD1_05720, partial [Candidatus Thorarchaeota archaeon]
FVVGFTNVVPMPNQSLPDTSNSTTITSGSPLILDIFGNNYEVSYYPLLNQIDAIIVLQSTSDAQLSINLILDEQNGLQGALLQNPQQVTLRANEPQQIEIKFYPNNGPIPIPLYSPSYNPQGNSFNLQFEVANVQGGSVTVNYTYNGKLYWMILAPISLLTLIIGVIVFIIGLVLNRGGANGRPKPLKYQSAVYEPNLSGMSSSSSSRRTQKTKSSFSQQKGKTQPPRATTAGVSTALCKQCGKPVPRRAQYCPHCYARQ